MDIFGLVIPIPFLFGLLGSGGVEVVALATSFDDKGELPPKFGKITYWIVRCLVGLMAGGLVLAYGVTEAILCVHIGASAPIIYSQFAKEPP